MNTSTHKFYDLIPPNIPPFWRDSECINCSTVSNSSKTKKMTMGSNIPPVNAITINRPDGTPYMHVWHECKGNRVCMMFGNMPGVSTQWAAQALPDLIVAFEKLQAEIERMSSVIVTNTED